MKPDSCNTPDTATGQKMADDITDKSGYAARWRFSPRHIDNLLAQGLPHLAIGRRRVRIIIAEADAWMKEKFGTRRRGLIHRAADDNGATKEGASR